LSKLKIVKAKEMEKVLFALGFEKIRQKGSHVFYKHPDGRYTTVPHHKGKTLARPIVRAILREIKVGIHDFHALLVGH